MLLAPPAQRPKKAQCFTFTVPEPTTAEVLIDAFEEVVGFGGLQYLQHRGGTRFLAAVSTMALARKMVAAGSVLVAGKEVSLVQMAAPVLFVSVFQLPPSVSDDALSAALSEYGKVRAVTETVLRSKSYVQNRIRVVKLDMRRAPPNFITVAGHRAMLQYRGMKKVCAKCGAEGHFRAACTAVRCGRCGAFGHSPKACEKALKRYGGNHATADCVLPRSHAASTVAAAASQHTNSATAEPLHKAPVLPNEPEACQKEDSDHKVSAIILAANPDVGNVKITTDHEATSEPSTYGTQSDRSLITQRVATALEVSFFEPLPKAEQNTPTEVHCETPASQSPDTVLHTPVSQVADPLGAPGPLPGSTLATLPSRRASATVLQRLGTSKVPQEASDESKRQLSSSDGETVSAMPSARSKKGKGYGGRSRQNERLV